MVTQKKRTINDTLLFVCVHYLHPSQQSSVNLGQFPIFIG